MEMESPTSVYLTTLAGFGILLGNGDGTLQPVVNYGTANYPSLEEELRRRTLMATDERT